MPKTKSQDIVFGIMMVVMMCLFMVTYNMAIENGYSGATYVMAIKVLPVIAIIAFLVEHFFVGKLAQKLAFRLVDPAKDRDIFITLAISCMTVCLMCPIMSFIGTAVFNFNGVEHILTNWFKAWALSFPAALLWNVFYAGPAVRFVFKHVFLNHVFKNEKPAKKTAKKA